MILLIVLNHLKHLSQTFHFEIDDPSGNSFIENPNAPYRDEQMTIKKYRRTSEQNSLLGITTKKKTARQQQQRQKMNQIRKS